MRKSINQLKLGFLGVTFALLTVGGSAAFALPPQAAAHAEDTTPTATTGRPIDPGSQAGTHLANAQLKSCQNRQKAINTIMARIVTRGDKQLTLFNTITQRVEAFKTSKNLIVTNYNALVATLQTDQTKAANDLTAMRTNGTLDCTGTDPKGMVSAFQADLNTDVSDLQTYRTDVKNLIVAVKTSIGDSSNSTNSSSTPSAKANSNATTGGNR